MKVRFIVAALLLGASASVTFAQSTVGAVLADGGKRLTSEELKSLLPGANMSGPNASGGNFETTLRPDGAVSGSVLGNGQQLGITGSWAVTDKDMYCGELVINARPLKYCAALFKKGDQYFVASDPQGNFGAQTVANLRTIKK